MSIAYKKNGVFVTASGTPPIDDALSTTSENAVQNKIVKQAVDGKSDTGHNHDDRYYTKSEIGTLSSLETTSKTDIVSAVNEVNTKVSKKAFKIKYQNTNWSSVHSFPKESVPRIGLILTHDGTLYSFVQYADGNISIQKIAGSHTITKGVSGNYNQLTVDAKVGLIVLVS